MSFRRKTLLALAISTATGTPLALANQAESQGFIEDSHLKFMTRNIYWNHDRHSGADGARVFVSTTPPATPRAPLVSVLI